MRSLFPMDMLAILRVCPVGGLAALASLLTIAACGPGVESCLEDESCGPRVLVQRVEGEVPLDPDAPQWTAAGGPAAVRVELGPQMITNPKWPDPSIKEVEIRAVRNASTLALRLEWEDDSLDFQYGPSANYTDQAALMFPLHPGRGLPPITMGGAEDPVNVWQWRAMWQTDLAGDEPGKHVRSGSVSGLPTVQPSKRGSPVEDLNAEGFSTLTTQEEQNVMGRGVWKDNRWRVVFRRDLKTPDNADVQLKGASPMAVAVWNGGNRERNGQKGLAGWLLLSMP